MGERDGEKIERMREIEGREEVKQRSVRMFAKDRIRFYEESSSLFVSKREGEE